MKPLVKPLLRLTAAELMSPLVISVPRQMSLHGAAHMLAVNHISGAPVVNDEGRCIGVISSTDFVSWAGGDKHPAERHDAPVRFYSDWTSPLPEAAEATVEQMMSPNPVTTGLATPLGALAQRMLDAHIHRVIVVDELDRPVGVVSSMDILAAVARAELVRASTPGSDERAGLVVS